MYCTRVLATSCLVLFRLASLAAATCLEFGSWGTWSDCSKTCGLGQHIRFRPRQAMLNGKCVRLSRAQAAALPPALSADGGGAGSAKLVQRKQCTLITCAAAAKAAEKAHKRSQRSDCRVGQWGTWATCSKACGNGVRRRTRPVLRAPRGGGKGCPLVYEAQPCQLRRCGRAPAGGWRGAWQLRHDAHGDRYWHNRATGSNSYSPPPGMFSPAALRRYDSQVQQRLRANGVLPRAGASASAFGAGAGAGGRPAAARATCVLGTAVPASPCSRSCGGGTRRYIRDAMRLPVLPALGRTAALQPRAGGACKAVHSVRPCNVFPCALDCNFGAWGQWSLCSRVCGGGVRSRSRTILKHEAYGGKTCPALRQIARCSTQKCGTVGSTHGAGSRGSHGFGPAFMNAMEAENVPPISHSPTPRPPTVAPTPRPTPAPQRFSRAPTPSPVPGWRDDWTYTGPSGALIKGAPGAGQAGRDSTRSAGSERKREHGAWRAQLGMSPPLKLQHLTIPWAQDRHKSIAHAWTRTTSTTTMSLQLLRCSSIHVGPMPVKPAWKYQLLQKTGVASYAGAYKLTRTMSNGKHVWQHAVAAGSDSAMGPPRFLYSYLHPTHGWMWVMGYRLGEWGPNTWAEDQLAIRAPSTSLLPPADVDTLLGGHSSVSAGDDDADMGQEYLTEKDASQAHPVWAVWHGIGAESGTMALPEVHVRCTGPRPPTPTPTLAPTPAPTATPTNMPTPAPTRAGTTLPWALVPRLQAVAVDTGAGAPARRGGLPRATSDAAKRGGGHAALISISTTMKLALAVCAILIGALIALVSPGADAHAISGSETAVAMVSGPYNDSGAEALGPDRHTGGEAEQRPLRQPHLPQPQHVPQHRRDGNGVGIHDIAQAWQA